MNNRARQTDRQAGRQTDRQGATYVRDPGHVAGRDGRHAGRVMLVLRQTCAVEGTALQLEPTHLPEGGGRGGERERETGVNIRNRGSTTGETVRRWKKNVSAGTTMPW